MSRTTAPRAGRRSPARSREGVDAIETELLLLARWLEAVQRRNTYSMDRAAYLLLRHLQTNGPATVAELAAALGLDGSTVTRQLRALDEGGHIRRTAHPEDARAIVVEPTAAGLAAADDLRTYRQDRIAGHFADWSATEQRELGEVLHRLNDVLARVARTP